MKKTFVSRIAVFMLAMLMLVGTVLPASAVECENMTVVAEETNAVTPRVYYWPCNPQEIRALTVDLSSYIGISKTFVLDTMIYSGSSSSGTSFSVSLMNENGTWMFQNQVMNVGESKEWKFTLPKSGTYTLIIDNGTNYEIGLFPHWQ